MQRMANILGCQKETIMGLSGMGDLILTCTSNLSRNRRFGYAIGSGMSLSDAQREIGQVIESLNNARTVLEFAQQHQIELPIISQVCAVLSESITPSDALHTLLSRAPKSEFLE